MNIWKLSRGFSFTYPCPRKLREIMKLSLIEREPKHHIIDIWMKYHSPRSENNAYAISKVEYEKLGTRLKQSPMFLMPIKKKSGHFMLIGQGNDKSFIFTYLEDFKRIQANAQPYYIMTMFDELLFKREVVLVRGDIINFKIDKEQADWVMNQTLRMYLTDDLYNKFVYNFNHQTHLFNYEEFKSVFQLN